MSAPSVRPSTRSANKTSLRERLLSPVGLHLAGFSLLAVLTLVLGIRLLLDWQATSSSSMDAMAGRQAELRTLELQTAPLRGLDKKVELSKEQIDQFYADRVPPSYSSVLERLGSLETKSPVKLTRVAYNPLPGSGDLTEVRMEAGILGDYRSIMHFINGLERNPSFFVIRAMSLTGQQSGAVNLRLQFSTWLRPNDAPKTASPAPDSTSPVDSTGASPAPAGEGR